MEEVQGVAGVFRGPRSKTRGRLGESIMTSPELMGPRCAECLLSLAVDAARKAGAESLEDEAERIIARGVEQRMTSPAVAKALLREIASLTGTPDPYKEFKAAEMAAANEVFERLDRLTDQDLRSCVSLAVLGNSLDFFRQAKDAFGDVPALFSRGVPFTRDDTGRLEGFLEGGPGLVLYLTDNSGEIFFDGALYDYIRRRSGRCVLVVKGGPSVNDLTRAELRSAGLEQRFDEVADTGTDGPGIDWDEVSAEFMDMVDRAELILSKGMANFETVYGRGLKPACFYLFRVKCRPIQDYLGIPVGAFVAMWEDGAGSVDQALAGRRDAASQADEIP